MKYTYQSLSDRKEWSMIGKINTDFIRPILGLLFFLVFLGVGNIQTSDCLKPPDNLISWWQVDENAKDTVDGNDGLLVNGLTYVVDKGDQAFSFDRIDDHVQINKSLRGEAVLPLMAGVPSRLDRKALLKQHDMVYEAAPVEWEQGLLLGNGNLGAVIWGDGEPLTITINRMDAWDEREHLEFGPGRDYQSLRKLLDEGQLGEAGGYNTYQEIPHPTNVCIGGIRLGFGSPPKGFEGKLSLFDATATGTVSLSNGKARFSGFIHAQKNLLVLEVNLEGDATLEYTPDVDCRLTYCLRPYEPENNEATLKAWGYPPAITGSDGALTWHVQEIPGSGAYCVMWALQEDTDARRLTLFLCVELSADGDPLSIAKERMDEALQSGKETLYEQHRAWWQEYWQRSALTIPDPKLENLYYAEMYKLACNTIGRVPVTWQGVWAQSKPDYHLNLNLQESYWPIYTSNHLELGNSLYDVFFEMLPRFQEFCRDFYGWDGAMANGVLSPRGNRVPTPFPWSLWTGSGPWVAHHFWLHYLYSRDEAFLREKAYPFMREFMKFFEGYLEKGEDGLYHLPWDSSPEYEYRVGWDVTCSLSLVRFLAEALLESQNILGIDDPGASAWKEILDYLTPYPEDQTGLLIMKDTPLLHSHRHHSHLMPIHPLGLLNVDGTEEERDLITRSINTWLRQGFGEWIGEDWPWASLIASRLQKGNMAFMFLERYADAFISENSLNMNSDWREYGLGSFFPKEIRQGERWPKEFSINGGFGAAAAVLEMLLQSWNGVVRVFPSVPDRWHDAWFEDLRAEGAFVVSSRLSGGKVAFIDITSEVGGTCYVLNPWSAGATVTSLSDGKIRVLDGDTLEIPTRKGDRLRLTPKGVKMYDSELSPPDFKRSPDQINWFGVKKNPRF